MNIICVAVTNSNLKKLSLHQKMSTKENEKEEIGIIIYCYKSDSKDNYCIYRYDPIYDQFVDKICETYKEIKGIENEKIVRNGIIPKSELDTIEWVLNGISNKKVVIDDLKELFKDIDPDDHEVDWFDYNDLLVINDDESSIIDLEKKRLCDFR